MDFQENFICPLCLELAKDAVESNCCTKIYCFKCIDEAVKKFAHCPCCRSKAITYHPSRIARKVISQIKLPCQHCETNVETGMMETHYSKCPKLPIKCRVCGIDMLQADFPKHMASTHQKEARQYLVKCVLQVKNSKQVSEVPKPGASNHNYFKPVNNRFGRRAILGVVSKYYCGGKMTGKCNCCDGNCGPDNGENCDACMELDVKKWNLAKTYLVNTAGYVCQVLRVLGTPKVTCFRITGFRGTSLFGNKEIVVCKAGSPCPPCAQVQNSLIIGRYTGLY